MEMVTGSGFGSTFRVRQEANIEIHPLRLVANTPSAEDKVVYAGTETSPTGNMTDGYFVCTRG